MFHTHQEDLSGTAVRIIQASNDRTAYKITGDLESDVFIGPSASVDETTGLRISMMALIAFEKKSGHDVHAEVWALTSAESARVSIREDFWKE